MEHRTMNLGGVCLVLLMVVLVTGTLGVLGVATARSDLAMAQNQAALAAAEAACEGEAQRWLAQVDAEIAAGRWRQAPTEAAFTDGAGHTLSVTLSVGPAGYTVTSWVMAAQWNDARPMESLIQIP